MGTTQSQNTFVRRASGNVRILYPRRSFWMELASRVGTWFSEHDGPRTISGGGQKIDVEPLQHLELDIPANVREIILVEDCLVGRLKKRAFLNGTTLWFLAAMFVVVFVAEFVSHVIWG